LRESYITPVRNLDRLLGAEWVGIVNVVEVSIILRILEQPNNMLSRSGAYNKRVCASTLHYYQSGYFPRGVMLNTISCDNLELTH